MKKNFLLSLVGVLAVLLGFTSCKKCKTCSYDGYTEEICQDDFDTKDQYKAYVKLLESYGAKCK